MVNFMSRKQLGKRRILNGVLAVLIAWVCVAVSSPQPALASTTYYVALTGSDTNPGTQAAPWRTIQKAANTLVAGDTVVVQSGITGSECR